MKYVVYSNEGYLKFDGTPKENISCDEYYMTFDDFEKAQEYVNSLKKRI